MKNRFKTALLVWTLALSPAIAGQVDFLFAGTITNDRDDLNWFSGAFPLNGTFSGRISYETTLPNRFNNPEGTFSQFAFNLDPADAISMSVTGLGGHTVSSTTPFYVNTYNNYVGTTTYDELYYAAYPNFNFDGSPLTMNYYAADFGVHFHSTELTSTATTDLPTEPPELSAFGESYFNVHIFSGTGNGPLAFITGEITSVSVVPEPAAGTLLFLGMAIAFMARACSRTGK